MSSNARKRLGGNTKSLTVRERGDVRDKLISQAERADMATMYFEWPDDEAAPLRSWSLIDGTWVENGWRDPKDPSPIASPNP